MKAMERLIDDRYESMHAFAGDLAKLHGGLAPLPALPQPIAATPAGPAIVPHGRLRIGMVHIPAGEFLMGSNEADDERPVHTVRIPSDFWVGAFPVTQAEYRAVMGKLPESMFSCHDRRPVDSVSWLDAVIFCNQLSARDDHDPYYKIQGRAAYVSREEPATAF